MKYWFLLVIICMASCTCNQQSPPALVNEEIKIEKDSVQKTSNLKGYALYLQNLDTNQVENNSLAVEKYKQLFIKGDTANADSAFVLFSSFYHVMLDKLLDQHYKNHNDHSVFTINRSSVIAKTPQAKQYISKLQINGFTLSAEEGSTFVKHDYDFIAQHFYNTVSITMRTYLEGVQKENKEGFLSDAAMVISPIILAQRIIFWDEFVNQHPAFVFDKIIREQQREYLTFLLEGVENTPLLDFQSKRLSPTYEEAYKFVLEKHPTSKLGGILQPYYKALKKKNLSPGQQILKQYRAEGKILYFEQ